MASSPPSGLEVSSAPVLSKEHEHAVDVDTRTADKPVIAHLEDDELAGHLPHADPELEKRVVRKLDWNFIPLLMGLCEYLLYGFALLVG